MEVCFLVLDLIFAVNLSSCKLHPINFGFLILDSDGSALKSRNQFGMRRFDA